MEEKSITFRSVLKEVFSTKFNFEKYLLITLTFAALGMLLTFLNYTDFSVVAIFILLLILIPFLVTFIEYSGLIESKYPLEINPKAFSRLFKNSFISGRTSIIFSLKTFLYFLLYLLICSVLVSLGFSLFIILFDRGVYDAMVTMLNQSLDLINPEVVSGLITDIANLFSKYNTAFILINQIYLMAGFIYLINRAIFNVNLSVFIEHRPTVKIEEMMKVFFPTKKSRKSLRRIQNITALIAILDYLIFYLAAYFIINAAFPNPRIFLQAELIGFISLVVSLVFATRINYFMYQQIMRPKREAVIRFSISEIQQILATPGIPEESKVFLNQVLSVRQEELKGFEEEPLPTPPQE